MNQNSINLSLMRVVGYREFGNKLWNIVKFALGNFPADFKPNANGIADCTQHMSLADKWIICRLNEIVQNTNKSFNEYKFGDMVMGLHEFWKKELADVYLEAIKPVMKNGSEEQKTAALNCLYICLDTALKLLHPTMPYLTEELYQRLPHSPESSFDSIMISAFPQHKDLPFNFGEIDADM
jgi:valyl-tRNA synthetase